MERGRPRKFNSPEEMQEAIDKYFAECEVNQKPKTMSGLAKALDVDRKTIVNYSEKEEYFHTVKRARQEVETQNEEMLIAGKGNATGIIFNLKNNFGWKDESKVENNFVGNIPLVLRELKNDKSDGNSNAVSTADKSEEEE